MYLLLMLKKPCYVVSALMVIVLITSAMLNAAPSVEQKPGVKVEGPVVLELFTSQGCSSCPPADAFLQTLASDPQWQDRIIPLSFHVDYWNYLGWKDPFSKAAWTERQGDYVAAMGGATLYTPQLVIHGRAETVGVRYGEIRKSIEKFAALPEAHVLKIEIASLQKEAQNVRGEVRLTGLLPAGQSQVRLTGVLFERGRDTEIRRGENAGKTLKNDYIVRNMVDLGQLQRASTHKEIHQEIFAFQLPIDHSLASSKFGVVVLAQDASSMKMLGATMRMLP